MNTGGTGEYRVELLLPVLSIDHALDSIAQMQDVEIDKQTDADAAQPHVRQKLCLVDRMDCFNTLHFDNNEVLDD